MKRFLLVLIGCIIAASVVVAAITRQEPLLRENSYVGPFNLGGKTKEQAQKSIREWWNTHRLEKVTVKVSDKFVLGEFTPTALGVTVDDVATINQIPTDSTVGKILGGTPEKKDYQIKFKSLPVDYKFLDALVTKNQGEPKPAKVKFVSGSIVAEPEVARFKLDKSTIFDAVVSGVMDDHVAIFGINEEPKKLTDEVLNQITDVVYSFSTRFNSGQVSRSTNIKLAASKVDGVILLPGEKFSFNNTVGRRTIEGGFKEAGVYLNGRHDTGVGGGICQVSTTLYNACLFSNLKIVRRSNHSMPVPYVPQGRDATVDYGSHDLVIENNMTTPVVFASTYEPGRLTFRVLGKKIPGQEVKITTDGHKSWDRGQKTEVDPTLGPNARKVVEKGCKGSSCNTYRTVYLNGQVVKKERLGQSYYAGTPRIIAVGKPVAKPQVTPGATVPGATAPTAPGTANPGQPVKVPQF